MYRRSFFALGFIIFSAESCTLPRDSPYDVNSPNHVTCDAPGYVSYTQMTMNSVRLSWNNIYNATSYTVQYQRSYPSTSVWITMNSITNSVLLTGLTPSVNYSVKVQAYCSSNGFSGSSEYFSTSFYIY